MPNKKVYFYKINMINSKDDTICSNNDFKSELLKTMDKHIIESNNTKMIDITERTDSLHTTVDNISISDTSVFMRLCKQRIRAKYAARDYVNKEISNVLPGNNETENGIESCTYSYIIYELGLLEIVASQTAPNETFLRKLFAKYNHQYFIDLLPIPSKHSVEALYDSDSPYIKKLEMDVPIPNNKMLATTFGWTDEEIEAINLSNNLKLSICLEPFDNNRGSFICSDKDSRKLIDIVKSKGKRIHGKAKLRGRENTANLRDYNFFEDNFGFNITIKDHHIDNGNVISHSQEILLQIHREEMTRKYNQYYEYFKHYLRQE